MGNFLFSFGFTGFMLLFNLYLKSVGYGEASIGVLLALGTYATMFAVLPAAFIARRIPLKPLFIMVVLFSAIGRLIPVISERFEEMIGGMVIFCFFIGNRRSPYDANNFFKRKTPFI